MATCPVPGCGHPEDSRTHRKMHATRLARTGDPMGLRSLRGRAAGDLDESMERRFLDALAIGDLSSDGFTRHLLFTVNIDSNGYGRLGTTRRPAYPNGYVLAHRYAYERWTGLIPDGHDLDHRPECPKACVNPAHLTPLTKSDHTRLGNERGERGTFTDHMTTEQFAAAGRKGAESRWNRGGV